MTDAFSVEEPPPGNAIRLSLGGAVDQGALAGALAKLNEILSEAPEARHNAIV